MATKTYHIGSLGPFPYDDTKTFPGGEPHGIVSDGIIRTSRAPTNVADVLRLDDIGSGGGVAPDTLAFVTIGNTGDLTSERALTAGAGMTSSDGGANSTVTLAIIAASNGGILVNANDFQLDINSLAVDTIAAGDHLPFEDITGGLDNKITFANLESTLNHDSLTGFVSNEHINHTSVILTAGAGLTGTGDISASRTFDIVAVTNSGLLINANDMQLDINSLVATAIVSGDFLSFEDVGGGLDKKVTVANLTSILDHGGFTGLSDDDHSQYALLAGRSGGQILIGGTGTTDDFTIQTTSGVGASGADMHFLVGNNGDTEALTILNNGNIEIPTTTSGGVGIITQNGSNFLHSFGTAESTFLGVNAGNLTNTGSFNVGIGSAVLSLLTSGTKNIGMDRGALGAVTSGDRNIGIGNLCLRSVTTTSDNVAIGDEALKQYTGSQCTAVGSRALRVNTGTSNTAVGREALAANTTGINNTAFGVNSLPKNISGSNNISLGAQTIQKATNVSNNVAIGHNALRYTTGGNNVAIGAESGEGVDGSSIFTENMLLGVNTGRVLTTGSTNSCIGSTAGNALTTGSSNLLMGYRAGDTLTTQSNLLFFTNTQTLSPLIYGEFDDFIRVNANTSVTNAVQDILKISHQTDGTPANGLGNGLLYEIESSTTEKREAARLYAETVDVTDATRKYRLVATAWDTAEREGMRIEASGSVAMIGFLGATAVVRPASTDDLKDAMIALGLYTTGGATPLNLDGGALTAATIDATTDFTIGSTIITDGVITDASGLSLAATVQITGDLNHDGTNVGLFGATPVNQASGMTTQLTSITHTAPGSPDYALQDLVDSAGGSAFGFATKDEGNTLLSVVLNLQVRVAELEAALDASTGIGVFA